MAPRHSSRPSPVAAPPAPHHHMALHITPPRAIIFDMDGLLLDSERVMLDLHRQASKELGVPWRLEVSLSVVGVSSRDTDRMLQAAYGPDYPLAKVRQRFMSLYEETIHSGGIPTKPFVHELMDKLDALRIPRAVATSTQRPLRRGETTPRKAHVAPDGTRLWRRSHTQQTPRQISTNWPPAALAFSRVIAWCWKTPTRAFVRRYRPACRSSWCVIWSHRTPISVASASLA